MTVTKQAEFKIEFRSFRGGKLRLNFLKISKVDLIKRKRKPTKKPKLDIQHFN